MSCPKCGDTGHIPLADVDNGIVFCVCPVGQAEMHLIESVCREEWEHHLNLEAEHKAHGDGPIYILGPAETPK